MGIVKRTLFNTALSSKMAAMKSGSKTWINWDALVFDKMKEMDKKGYVHFPEDKSKRLRQIRYLDEQKGVPVSNLWIDIPPVNSQAKEDTGWPTQKPLALLRRIIKSSSKEVSLPLLIINTSTPFASQIAKINSAPKRSKRSL